MKITDQSQFCLSYQKYFKRVVYIRLLKHLTENNILYQNQYGFRTGHSTAHAILQLIDQITRAIDTKEITVGVFLDLSKAFDTVNHNILLHKLHHYGIRNTAQKWFRSYMENRKQYVRFNNTDSEFRGVKCGVPQGSILGPLLFLIYINDLPNANKTLYKILFADDTNLFYSHKNLTHAMQTVNNELNKTSQWLNSNRLSLNVTKTHFMLFKTQGKLLDSASLPIKISDENISQVKSSKFCVRLLTKT